MQNKKYFYQGITVVTCASILILGWVYFAQGTTIGTDIETVNLSATGNSSFGTSTTAGVFTVGTSTNPIFNITTEGNIAFGTTSPLGLFTIGTSSDTILNVTTEGKVAIGTTSPTNTFSVSGTMNADGHVAFGSGATVNQNTVYGTDAYSILNVQEILTSLTATANNGIYSSIALNAAANETETVSAINGEIQIQSGNTKNYGTLKAVEYGLYHDGSGTVSNMTGVGNYLANSSTGTITAIYKDFSNIWNTGGGTITEAYGSYNFIINTSGTIGTGYGIYLEQPSNSGTWNNNYGLYIADQTITDPATSYNIYSVGAKNYFGGNVGIGTTTPTSLLDVYAATDTTAILFEQDGAGSILDIQNATGTLFSINNIGDLSVYQDLTFVGDGAGLAFANMYLNENATITVAATDTWYEVDTASTTDFNVGETNEIDITDHYMTVSIAGRYLITYSMAIETSGPNDELAGAISINGTANESSHGHSTVVSANQSVQVSGSTILDLAATNQISLSVQNHTGIRNIVVSHMNITIVMVGGS